MPAAYKALQRGAGEVPVELAFSLTLWNGLGCAGLPQIIGLLCRFLWLSTPGHVPHTLATNTGA